MKVAVLQILALPLLHDRFSKLSLFVESLGSDLLGCEDCCRYNIDSDKDFDEVQDVTNRFITLFDDLDFYATAQSRRIRKLTEETTYRSEDATTPVDHSNNVPEKRELFIEYITGLQIFSAFLGGVGSTNPIEAWFMKWGSFGIGSYANYLGPTWSTFKAEFDKINEKLDNIVETIANAQRAIIDVIEELHEDNLIRDITIEIAKKNEQMNSLFLAHHYMTEANIEGDEEYFSAQKEALTEQCQPHGTRAPRDIFRYFYSHACSTCRAWSNLRAPVTPLRDDYLLVFVNSARNNFINPDSDTQKNLREVFRQNYGIEIISQLYRSLLLHLICPVSVENPCDDHEWKETLLYMLEGIKEVASNLDFTEDKYFSTCPNKSYRVKEVLTYKYESDDDDDYTYEEIVVSIDDNHYWPTQEDQCDQQKESSCQLVYSSNNGDQQCLAYSGHCYDTLDPDSSEHHEYPFDLKNSEFLEAENDLKQIKVEMKNPNSRGNDYIYYSDTIEWESCNIQDKCEMYECESSKTENGKTGKVVLEVKSNELDLFDTITTLEHEDYAYAYDESRGNIKVKYFNAPGWSNLGDKSFESMTIYKTDYVDTIDFADQDGEFATSDQAQNVAALFEGTLRFDKSGTYEICIKSDDGSLLYIDENLLINNDGVHGDTTICSSFTATGENLHFVEVKYFERGGGATCVVSWKTPGSSKYEVIPSYAWVDGPSMPTEPVPTSTPTIAQNVLVKYYVANNWGRLPVAGLKSLDSYKQEMVETIDFRAGNGPFAGSELFNNIAALFKGFLDFPSDGTSTELCIVSDDGSKLYIDDSLEIDNDGLHGDKRVCKLLALSGPQKVTIEFFERGGGATMVLEWKLAGSSLTVVPASAWVNE